MPRRRRQLGLGATVLFLLGGIFLTVQVLQVRSDLKAAVKLAGPLEDQVRAGDDPALGPFQSRVHKAATGADGHLWRLAEHIPFFGTDLRAVRRAAQATDRLSSDALPHLADAAKTVRHGRIVSNQKVDLVALERAHADVSAARPVIAGAHRTVKALHPHFVDAEVKDLQRRLARLDDAVATADDALAQAPAMLGVGGERRYLLAVQNNAEARATGGLIGAVGELVASNGRLELVRTVTDDRLRSAPRPVPDDPKAARTWVAIGSTLAWFDANLTPNVPDAGRNVAGLWRAQTGQRVDGVVFVDAVALQGLMRHPVALPAGKTIAAKEVVDFICRRQYVDFPDNEKRKPLLRLLAGAIFDDVTHGGDLNASVDVARGGHLMTWFARPVEQSLVAGRLIGGTLPTDGSAYLEVLSQNFGGNKLDYFLQRRVSVRREGDALRVTVELRNTTPLGLPGYVTVRSDRPIPPVPYGQAKVGLSLYGGKGARFDKATLDGKPVMVQVDFDHGLSFATIEVEVPRGRPVTLSLLLKGPSGLLTYRQQPLVRPDELDLQVPHRVLGS